MKFTEEQKRIAKLIGIRNLDSQNDLNKIAAAQQTAKLLGIRNFDSANDASQVANATATAQRLGIRNIDSARDIEQIRTAPPVNTPETTPEPTPEPTPTPAITTKAETRDGIKTETKEPFDFDGALKGFQNKFERDIADSERKITGDIGSLEDRLRDIQNRPNTDPLERARVMGVRFAGSSNRLKKKSKNPFANRKVSPLRIKSTAINI